jgi:hypothetical protein
MDERLMGIMEDNYQLGMAPANPPHRDGSRECQPVPSATQVGGDHYTKQPIQVFEYTMANKMDPMQHTIIKYVSRFRDKGGREDLEKAKHTIDLLIEHEYGEKK